MSAEHGYLYRFVVPTPTDVRELITQHVFTGSEVFAFGGTTTKLLSIAAYPDAVAVPVENEFGHAFSLQAEIRWKRRDDDQYDVLLLMEQAHPNATPLISPLNVRTPATAADILLKTPPDVTQRRKRWRLGYKEYIASNGAVQFTRLVRRREEPIP